jgi:hypothetical protein
VDYVTTREGARMGTRSALAASTVPALSRSRLRGCAQTDAPYLAGATKQMALARDKACTSQDPLNIWAMCSRSEGVPSRRWRDMRQHSGTRRTGSNLRKRARGRKAEELIRLPENRRPEMSQRVVVSIDRRYTGLKSFCGPRRTSPRMVSRSITRGASQFCTRAPNNRPVRLPPHRAA